MTPADLAAQRRRVREERRNALIATLPERRIAARRAMGLPDHELASVYTERRILVAMQFERDAFERAYVLGLDDFTDPHCVAVLSAIRGLPNHFGEATYDAVMQELEMRDLRGEPISHAYFTWNTGERGFVADHVRWWLLEAMIWEPPYNSVELVEHDIGWLRELTRRRSEIARSA
jgi:hypothetical protein